MKINYEGRVWPRKSNVFDLREKKTGWFLEYIPPSKSNCYFVTKVYSSSHSVFFLRSKKVDKLRVYILLWDCKKYFFTSKIYFPDKILLWLISWVPPLNVVRVVETKILTTFYNLIALIALHIQSQYVNLDDRFFFQGGFQEFL